MNKVYVFTEEQINILDVLLTNCYQFAEGTKSEGLMKVIVEFDNEVFDDVKRNHMREEED